MVEYEQVTEIPAQSLSTRVVHPPIPQNVQGRPISVPIYQTSVFAFDSAEEIRDALGDPRGAYAYSRVGNPTVRSLEQAVSGLEGAHNTVATSSGMGAITVAMCPLLEAGDHVVIQESLYGGTMALFADLTKRWGVTFTEIPGTDLDALRAAIQPNTKVLYLETISNPMTNVADIPGMSAVAREHGLITVVDSTFTSPVVCRPLELGADVVVHSTTKYLGGHSDLTGGVACYADEELFKKGWNYAVVIGVTPDPHAAWLTLRGIQTLTLRVRQACSNAEVLAARLAEHPKVVAVHHPSIPTHPQHLLAAKVLDRMGPMLSFDLASLDAAFEFSREVKLIQAAPTMGGVETLTSHPATSSNRGQSEAELAAAGISQGTVRISTGIEDAEDLWADMARALDAVTM